MKFFLLALLVSLSVTLGHREYLEYVEARQARMTRIVDLLIETSRRSGYTAAMRDIQNRCRDLEMFSIGERSYRCTVMLRL